MSKKSKFNGNSKSDVKTMGPKETKPRNKGGKQDRHSDKVAYRDDRSEKRRQEAERLRVNNRALDALNDYAWWAENPLLLEAAGRVAFPYKPGMSLPLNIVEDDGYTATVTNHGMRVPGAIAIRYDYSIGYTSDVNSAASVCAKELYAQIRSRFGGSLDEDPPDLFMYIFALDQIYSGIAWLKRLYRTINLWSGMNYDYPHVIVRAMNVPYALQEDVRTHMTEFWGQINYLVHQVNKFRVPKTMHIFDRHRWMNENVYLDNPTAMSQSYLFTPRAFYKLDETLETGTSLKRTTFNTYSGISTMSGLIKYFDDLIKALSDWGDAYTINGHIQSAFEGTPFVEVELIAQDEILDPVYVPEVLSQIENLVVLNSAEGVTVDLPDITQNPNTNAIVYMPTAQLFEGAWYPKTHLNIHKELPSVLDIAEATRLTPVLELKTPTSHEARVHCGTEIPMEMYMYVSTGGSNVAGYQMNTVLDLNFGDDNVSLFVQAARIFKRAYWNHAPLTYWKLTAGDADPYYTIQADLSNITEVSDDQMKELH